MLKDLQVTQEPKVLRAQLQVLQDQQEIQVLKELKVLTQVLKVLQDQQEIQVLRVVQQEWHQVHQVPQVLKEPKALKV